MNPDTPLSIPPFTTSSNVKVFRLNDYIRYNLLGSGMAALK